MPVLGAGSAHGRDSGRGRRRCELAVCVAVTGRRCCAWCYTGAGAGAGRRKLARRCSALVPASDSEVITAAASDSEGHQTAAAAVKGDQAPLKA